jgi:hypothetical protein
VEEVFVASKIELRAFMAFDMFRKELSNTKEVSVDGEITGQALLEQLDIPANMVEVIFVNARPSADLALSPAGSGGPGAQGVPGPYRVLLWINKWLKDAARGNCPPPCGFPKGYAFGRGAFFPPFFRLLFLYASISAPAPSGGAGRFRGALGPAQVLAALGARQGLRFRWPAHHDGAEFPTQMGANVRGRHPRREGRPPALGGTTKALATSP